MASANEQRLATESGDYLRDTNFKTLCEWLTAEVSETVPDPYLTRTLASSLPRLRAIPEGQRRR
jgi:hypothetical protein